ncbi:MAG TPA: hypothetical protein VGY54_01895, partial [Polyangiaceae bacterium]|nr:hypothetical protein [Polyangiaceae bacterium]
FDALFEGASTKFDLVITFLALLEMTRLKMTRLLQSEPLGPLCVELAVAEPPATVGADAESGGR